MVIPSATFDEKDLPGLPQRFPCADRTRNHFQILTQTRSREVRVQIHGVRREHAQSLADLLLRRSGLVWTGLIDAAVVERAAEAVAQELGWSERERAHAVRAFLAEYSHRYGVPDDIRSDQSSA